MKILNGHIEELVLTTLLKEGSLKASELVELAFRKNQYTKQGVYRVLRKLKAEEKIVIYTSVVSINNFWREQVQTILGVNHTSTSIIGDVRGLKSEDRLSLKLRGLNNADQVWSHLFIPIEKELPNKHPLFLYNPHNWTFLLREETDRVHAERLAQNKRPTYLTVGSTSAMDKLVTKEMQFAYLEYSFSRVLRTPSYIAVLGDYVFEMRLSHDGNVQLNSIFVTDDPEAARRKIREIENRVVCRITVEKNPSKAILWKRRLWKDFYIPKKHRGF